MARRRGREEGERGERDEKTRRREEKKSVEREFNRTMSAIVDG
jgi:hypothetical protein